MSKRGFFCQICDELEKGQHSGRGKSASKGRKTGDKSSGKTEGSAGLRMCAEPVLVHLLRFPSRFKCLPLHLRHQGPRRQEDQIASGTYGHHRQSPFFYRSDHHGYGALRPADQFRGRRVSFPAENIRTCHHEGRVHPESPVQNRYKDRKGHDACAFQRRCPRDLPGGDASYGRPFHPV